MEEFDLMEDYQIQQIVWKGLMKFQRIPFEKKGNVHHQSGGKTMPCPNCAGPHHAPLRFSWFTGSNETTVICHFEKLDVPRTVYGFKRKKHKVDQLPVFPYGKGWENQTIKWGFMYPL